MNYDEFRDTHDMEFHGKVYDIVLNVCQYRDKETKTCCIKAEVYDEESEVLRTIYGSCTEFKFKRKGSIEKPIKQTCGSCLNFKSGRCITTGMYARKDDVCCDDYVSCT